MNPPQHATTVAPELRGAVVRPGEPWYEELRRLQNVMLDRRPAMIARVADTADVAAAVVHAAEHGLPLAVHGGGHSSFGVVDGALVVDTRDLTSIVVDPVARTVRVGAGVTVGALDEALGVHGLAVTSGRVPSVGVTGFTLGSGSGWLERVMGLAADNLRSATVVTADGRVVTASQTEHPDLFWALRGGGGNFGVVTELELRVMPLGPIVLGGLRLYPFSRAREVLSAYATVMASAPDELCGGIALMSAPPAPFVPAALHGEPVVATVVLWAGDRQEGDAGLAPLAALGEPLVDLVQPMPYVALQSMLAPPPGAPPLRAYVRFGFADELTPEAVDAVVALGGELGAPMSQIILQPLGGAFGRTGAAETALGERDAGWAFQLLTLWPDPADDAGNIAWTRAAVAELSDHGRPAPWPNFVTETDGRRLAVPYDPATLERLQTVKRAWDPGNLFRANHNIRP